MHLFGLPASLGVCCATYRLHSGRSLSSSRRVSATAGQSLAAESEWSSATLRACPGPEGRLDQDGASSEERSRACGRRRSGDCFARKVRLALTALAILLGVSFVSAHLRADRHRQAVVRGACSPRRSPGSTSGAGGVRRSATVRSRPDPGRDRRRGPRGAGGRAGRGLPADVQRAVRRRRRRRPSAAAGRRPSGSRGSPTGRSA